MKLGFKRVSSYPYNPAHRTRAFHPQCAKHYASQLPCILASINLRVHEEKYKSGGQFGSEQEQVQRKPYFTVASSPFLFTYFHSTVWQGFHVVHEPWHPPPGTMFDTPDPPDLCLLQLPDLMPIVMHWLLRMKICEMEMRPNEVDKCKQGLCSCHKFFTTLIYYLYQICINPKHNLFFSSEHAWWEGNNLMHIVKLKSSGKSTNRTDCNIMMPARGLLSVVLSELS